jgi:drug/metabolite transporter superfamily protein YnfA
MGETITSNNGDLPSSTMMLASTVVVDILNNSTDDQQQHDDNNSSNNGQTNWTALTIFFSISLFIISGIFEVGGGYMVWQGLRERRLPWILIPLGALVLFAYGVIPTFQPGNVTFGRVYAVYGGFFIVLSYIWSMIFDNFKPDKGDYIGASIALVGVCIAWFWPR